MRNHLAADKIWKENPGLETIANLVNHCPIRSTDAQHRRHTSKGEFSYQIRRRILEVAILLYVLGLL